MKKILLLTGIILINGMLFSCSNDDDQNLDTYQNNVELFGTGGEEGITPPPPPPPIP
ncbi:MAG: hypothetical protein R3342_04370 [Lutibacter sp.]|uniref:hypothetical protein n=1 Tax=Lutibacter sp. TaxID=1925666 RepID=UPI00299DAF21|nr:hypothetical protein [Lutibacter sp.]MDX1828763.1 hypothetical protein [Lutibacter sp.]